MAVKPIDVEELKLPTVEQLSREIDEEEKRLQDYLYQQALEEEARRRATEWIGQRPLWQKVADVALPGAQFRTSPEEKPKTSWYTRLDELLGGVLPYGQPYEEGALRKRAQRVQLDLSKPEHRAEFQRRLGIEGPLLPEDVLRKEANVRAVTTALGLLGAEPAVVGVQALLASKAAGALGGLTQKAIGAVRAMPKAAQIAGAIGAGATAGEAVRGALVPEAKEQTLPARFGASLRAGFGDVLATAGSVADRLKYEHLGKSLKRAAEKLRAGYEIQPVEFSWKSFFNPDWYAVNVARSLPLTLSLIPAMYVGYKTGSLIGARTGLNMLYRAILGSLVGGATSRVLEAAFEAGSAYEDYLAKNPNDVAGAERVADKVFKDNLKLMAVDAFQLATAFAPVPVRPQSSIGRAVLWPGRVAAEAGTEAGEEAFQEIIQRQAAGEPVRFDEQMKEAAAIGALFGAGFGGVGNIVEYIRERALRQLPQQTREKIVEKAEANVNAGADVNTALDIAVDEVMSEDETERKRVEKAVDSAVSELDRMVKTAEQKAKRKKAVKPAEAPIPEVPKPEAEIKVGDVVLDAKGRRWRVVGVSDTLLDVVNEQGVKAKLGTKTAAKVEEGPPAGEVRPETATETVPAAPTAAPAPEKPPKVSPKEGRTYTVRIVSPISGLKPGQEFTGTVRRIYRVRSGAVLAELEMPDGRKRSIPVSKYAEWYPAETVPEAAVKETVAPVEAPVSQAPPAKEPWQMTLEEFVGLAPAEARPQMELAHQTAVVAALRRGDPVPQEVLGDYPALAERFARIASTWQLPQKQAVDIIDPDWETSDNPDAAFRTAAAEHKEIVEQALAEGKPVPSEVLKDYPDLAAKYAKYEGEPSIPIRYRPIRSRSGEGFVLYDEHQGITSGEPMKTWEEAVEAANKANRRYYEQQQVSEQSRQAEEAKYPKLEWGKDAAGYKFTLQSDAAYERFLREAKEVAYIDQAYGHQVPVYYYRDQLVRVGPHGPHDYERPVHVVDPYEYGSHFHWRNREDIVEIAKTFGAEVRIKTPIVSDIEAGTMQGTLKVPSTHVEIIQPPRPEAAVSPQLPTEEVTPTAIEARPSIIEEKPEEEAKAEAIEEAKPAAGAATVVQEIIGDRPVRSYTVEHGALAEVPIYETHARGRNWFAVIEPNPRAPGGLERRFADRAKGKYYYIVDNFGLKPGDAVEFGTDYYTRSGGRRASRWYGVIVEVAPDHIAIAKTQTADEAYRLGQQIKRRLIGQEVYTRAGQLGISPEKMIVTRLEEGRGEHVPGAPERRGDTGQPAGEKVEGRGEAVLGEVAPEAELRAEEAEEVRGHAEPARGERAEDVEQDLRRPVRESRGESRERLPGEGREDEGRELHGRRASERDVAVAAAREGRAAERGTNYVITDPAKLEEGGPVTKARKNLEAIKLLKQLEEEGRLATPEEQEVLAGYTGWGAAWQVFDFYRHPEARTLYDLFVRLKNVLTPQEFAAAERSTQYAHYTAPAVIRAMWRMAERLGFSAGRVLEPAMGTGYFFGLMPAELAEKSQLVGVEIEPIAGKIARHLYPEAKIYVQGFEQTALPNNFFDLAISNVPFGDIPVTDSAYPKYLTNKLHNYFFVKALDKVRPGGLVMFISSTGTMDARANDRVRRYLAEKADLIAAIRLPRQTHKKVAQTEVTTDIIILRKRMPGEAPAGEAWVESKESGVIGKDGKPLYINEYFLAHPDMVIGNLVEDKLHLGRVSVDGSGINLEQSLEEAISKLPQGIVVKEVPKATVTPSRELKEGKPDLAEGAILVREGKVYTVENGNLVAFSGKQAEKVKQLAEIRDVALEVLSTQYRNGSDEELKDAQARLNRLYDSFVKKYGLIYENSKEFGGDPNVHVLRALEVLEYDTDARGRKVVKGVTKADIFTKRTIRGFQPAVRTETAIDALVVSLAERGKVDLARIAELVGKTEEEVAKELEGRIFKNPETGDWETAEQYLSGNVRAKLHVAKVAAELNPAYRANVEALEKVVPPDVSPQEIRAIPGAPWIPDEYLVNFLADLLHTAPQAISITRLPTGKWDVEIKSRYVKQKALNTNTHGTPSNPAHKLFEMILNKQLPVEYVTVRDHWGMERRVIDQGATQLARQKQQELIKLFAEWLWSDPARAEEMSRKYNEIYNVMRLPVYDGSHLTFPGLSAKIKPWQHQKNAVWRILTSPTGVLIGHGVGKGKTLTLAMATMELRRLGIAKKPMIVVPVNLKGQWERLFREYYPGAKILVLGAEDLPGLFQEQRKEGETEEQFLKRKEQHLRSRKEVLMRIATGDWDAVIITQTAFMRLPVTPELEKEYIERELTVLREHFGMLEMERRREGADRRTIKQLQAIIQRKEERLKQIFDERKRDILVMPFEELGVDWLMVDEAHAYKNLHVATRLDGVLGVPKGAAERAMDMHVKASYILSLNNGRGVVFATGTPITNTMAEMYNLMRYLTPAVLDRLGTSHFDDWASVFTRIGQVYDYNPAARKYEAKRALSRYINVAELVQFFHWFADIVPNRPNDPDVPKLKGGNRIHVAVEPSAKQLELFGWLMARLESIKAGGVDPREDNALKVYTDGAKISLDPRLIDPSLPDDPESKINRAIRNIFDIWKRTQKERSTQLVFLDISVPSREAQETISEEQPEEAQENIVLYHEIKRKLVSLGVPAKEIAFIHEAKNPAQQEALSEKFNAGEIRILLGSSGKMGVGMNLQKRLIALHHVDTPWRPDEIEQREGRILRPGNENPEVEMYVYGTKRSFDLVRWNKVVYKAGFIAQTLAKGTTAREIEAPDDLVLLSYEEARAAYADNPLVEEKVKVDGEIARLNSMLSAYQDEKRLIKYKMELAERHIGVIEERIKQLEEDVKRREDTRGDKFRIVIHGQEYTKRDEANAALSKLVQDIVKGKIKLPPDGEVGSFAGFKLAIALQEHSIAWSLRGAGAYAGFAEGDMIRSMEAILRGLESELQRARQTLEYQKKQVADLREAYAKPFPEQERLKELYARQRQLNIQLGVGEGLTADIIRQENVPHDEDEVYPLPQLEEIRGKSDVVLANRIKGEPTFDVYYLPLYAPHKTSVKQVARGLRLGVEKGIFKKGMIVADVGGGLYEDGTRYLAEHGITNLVYDPYARTQEHNEDVLRMLYNRGGADAVALNNVLNVIPKAEDRQSVLQFAYGLLKNGGRMVVTVYEGDGSGKGSTREFKDGTYTWQENRKLDDYESEIKKALPTAIVEKKYGAYIITKPQKDREYDFYALAKPQATARVFTVQPKTAEPSKLSPKAARAIAAKLTEVLDTTVRATRATGKLAGKRGVYEAKPHAVRTRRAYLDHWRTVGHELGHAFKEHAAFKPDSAEMNIVFNELYPGVVASASKMTHEGFAEFLMLYFADNAKAKQLAPKTYARLEAMLAANPVLKQAFEGARAIAEEDLAGTPLGRTVLYISRRNSTPTAIGEYRVPWWKRPTFQILDGSIPLRDLYQEAVKKGFEDLDPAKLYAISGMAWDQAIKIFEHGAVYARGGRITPGKRSLANILEEAEQIPNGMLLLELTLRNLHWQEIAEKGRPIPRPKAEVDAAVEQAKRDYPEIVRLAKEYSEVLSETCLQMLVKGEVISEETAERIRNAWEWYMPLYVRRPQTPLRAEPLRSSGPGVARLRGHTAEELPLIEATLLKLHDTVQAVELNRLMQTIEESLKLPNMGQFGIIVERPVVAKRVRLSTILEQIEEFLTDEADIEDGGRIITIFMPGYETDLRRAEPIVVARHGNKETYMYLARDLFEAVQSLRPITYNMVVKVLSWLGYYGRLGALANIRFVTNNMARDLMQSAIQSRTTFERSMMVGYLKGALIATGYGEKAEEIMNLYIQSGAYGSAPQEVLKSMMRSAYADGLLATPAPGWKKTATGILVRIVNTPLDVLRIQEEAPRVAEFLAVLQEELKPLDLTLDDVLEGKVPPELTRKVEKALVEAAYASRQVIVNYGLHGVSEGWRMYVRCVPFLHGSLQGIYRAYQQVKDDPAETLKRWIVFVLPVTLLAWALSHDDDRYRDMPSEARDRYWWFPAGNQVYYAVAKPYEYALPANMIERLLDWLIDQDVPHRRKPLEDFTTAVKQAFGVELMPMVVSAIWDIARNKNSFGGPIEPKHEEMLPPEYRFAPGTTKAAKVLSEIAARVMGQNAPSPRQIEYFARAAFGVLGTGTLKGLSVLMGEPLIKQAGVEHIPFVGALLYGPMESGSRVVDRFYKDYETAQKLYNAYRLHGRQLNNREQRLVLAIPAMRAIADKLSELRRQVEKIEASDEYTLEEKRRARLTLNWLTRLAAGYLYGLPAPSAPPETGITEAHVQDYLRAIEASVEEAIIRSEKREGGPR